MAGGKETPRQKLIGLMYLVLLALLALQVPDTVIQNFFFMEQSLLHNKNDIMKRNESALSAISDIAKERNTDFARETEKKAKELHSRTTTLLTYIEDVRKNLIEKTGGYDKDNPKLYKGLKATDEVSTYMVGPGENKNGRAYELRTKLNEYQSYLNANFKDVAKNLEPLAKDVKDDDVLRMFEANKGKDFAQVNFAHVPMIAAMAVLADKAASIATYEQTIMATLNPEGKTIKFDEIIADYKAESRVVAAGTKYKAQIFLAGKNKSLVPSITYQGKNLPVDENGFGTIEFTASGGGYVDGKAKKSWEATVMVPGQEKPLPIKGEYEVAEPVIDVSSGAVQALYLNCGNPLKINVPALGANYDPSFSSNAQIIKGQDKINVTVVPTSKAKVGINVSSGGVAIGKKEFDVRDVPNPYLEVMVGAASKYDPLKGLSKSASSIKLVAQPDAGFAAALPKEARYEIEQAQFGLIRGGTLVGGFQPAPNGLARVGGLNPAAGDQIVIKVDRLVRKNFKDQNIEVELPQSQKSQIIRISNQ